MRTYKLFYVSICLLWFLGGASLRANSVPPVPSGHEEVADCTLSAAKYFHTTNVGTTFVETQWDAIPNADRYLLSTYELNSGKLVSTLAPAGTATTATVTGLAPGTEYQCILVAVCSNGEKSSERSSVEFITLVLDLIVSAPPPNLITEGCEVVADGPCGDYPWLTGVGQFFEITDNKGNTRLFEAFKGNGLTCIGVPLPTIQRVGINQGDAFVKFYGEGGATPPACTNAVVIKRQLAGEEVEICRLVADIPPAAANYGRIKVESIAQGYSIKRILTYVSPHDEEKERTEAVLPLHIDKSWAASPFTDQLEVTVPTGENATGQITLDLFDLNGRIAVSKQYPCQQSQCIIPTADLAPGLYFLRIGANGQISTLKVVKSR